VVMAMITGTYQRVAGQMRTEDIQGFMHQLADSLPEFLLKLKSREEPGKFHPCLKGRTSAGDNISLGFSCFALKTYYTLGLWEELGEREKADWLKYIKSFQSASFKAGNLLHSAFIDTHAYSELTSFNRKKTLVLKDVQLMLRHPRTWVLKHKNRGLLTDTQKMMIAETKQTISTLTMVGQRPLLPYDGMTLTPGAVGKHLAGLEWATPWRAGGQASAVALFLNTEAPHLQGETETYRSRQIMTDFIGSICDSESGGYFSGKIPQHGQLVNGAMKVLNTIQWLNEPIHYPERLIDTTLSSLPESEGCHLVDAIYVLHRCLKQTDYRRKDICDFCVQILEMIRNHYREDGGFSFYEKRSQTHYYQAIVSEGQKVADIQGTGLLVWGIAMILEILEINSLCWRVYKP
jgi:hypothetical protein